MISEQCFGEGIAIGTTKSKQGSMLTMLMSFKKQYDANTALESVFPSLVAEYPDYYQGQGLRDHCQAIHDYTRKTSLLALMSAAYEVIPEGCDLNLMW